MLDILFKRQFIYYRTITKRPGLNWTETRASKIGFWKYTRLEEIGTIGGATGADSREK
jgi:hypothetical protein